MEAKCASSVMKRIPSTEQSRNESHRLFLLTLLYHSIASMSPLAWLNLSIALHLTLSFIKKALARYLPSGRAI
ncbi:hypothetical protein J6590_097745 [Homalodisca vitripennis]|nr:hypothetical protein J6590_097745 [Homalodisca vitripennis]